MAQRFVARLFSRNPFAARESTVQKARQHPPRRRHAKPLTGASWSRYIYAVLKQTQPQLGISKKAMAIMQSFVLDMIERIGCEAKQLQFKSGRKTLTVREIQTAVRLVLPGTLALHSVSQGRQAWTNYCQTL